MKIYNKKFKKWIKALRSGKYSQTTRSLQDEYGYCCLGLACKVLIPKNKLKINGRGFISGGMPEQQEFSPNWLIEINSDFMNITGRELTKLNDGENFSFDEIADLLELVYIHNMLPENYHLNNK